MISCACFQTARMAKKGCVALFDQRDGDQLKHEQPFLSIPLEYTANSAVWAHLDDTVIIGQFMSIIYYGKCLRLIDDSRSSSSFNSFFQDVGTYYFTGRYDFGGFQVTRRAS